MTKAIEDADLIVAINNNMRCFEIQARYRVSPIASKINNNMRCFEIMKMKKKSKKEQ